MSAGQGAAASAALLPALRTNPWFASCSEAMQQALLQQARVWHIAAGQCPSEQAGWVQGLVCVVAGALTLSAARLHGASEPPSPEGSFSLAAYIEPYHWFGEADVLDPLAPGGIAHTQTVRADIDSTLLLVSCEGLCAWLDQHPACWRELARLACRRLRCVQGQLDDLVSWPLEQTLARRLLASLSPTGQAGQTQPKRHVRLPQAYLARMLGVSRQTVNKVLRQFEREGVLALRYAEIEIKDVARLRAKAEGVLKPEREA